MLMVTSILLFEFANFQYPIKEFKDLSIKLVEEISSQFLIANRILILTLKVYEILHTQVAYKYSILDISPLSTSTTLSQHLRTIYFQK